MTDEKATINVSPRWMLKTEWPLLLSYITTGLFLMFGKQWLADLSNMAWFGFMSLWLLVVILASAFAVVHHAEALAMLLGEPFGTLILTLAVTGLEVMMVSAVMLTGDGKPEMGRDTMFAVVMIVINGIIGLSLLVGGLKHHEQEYNLKGANSFLALIFPLAILGLVLPNFTTSSAGPTLSPFQGVFLSIMSIGIYAIFLMVQTNRHRNYFIAPKLDKEQSDEVNEGVHHDVEGVINVPYHAVLLILYLLPMILLAKQLAKPLDYGINVLGAPAGLSGFIIAMLILSPEVLSAVKAAQKNELQRSVNIALGSVLATIGLSIPALLTIGMITGKTIVLGLDSVDMVMLILTLAVSIITFSRQRTNILLGANHLLLFFAYLMLIFAS